MLVATLSGFGFTWRAIVGWFFFRQNCFWMPIQITFWLGQNTSLGDPGSYSFKIVSLLNILIKCSPHWDWDGFTLGTDEAGDFYTA